MTTITTEYYKKHRIEVHVDEHGFASNPRDWDNGSVMVMSHRRYNLPNEADIDFDAFDGWDEVEAHIRKAFQPVGLLPIYMYDHSGVAYSTTPFHCPWDSGQVGFIFMTKAGQAEMGTPDEYVDELLRSDVEVFGQWAGGEVYGYVVLDADGEEVDACWGMIGDTDYPLAEAKAYVDAVTSEG